MATPVESRGRAVSLTGWTRLPGICSEDQGLVGLPLLLGGCDCCPWTRSGRECSDAVQEDTAITSLAKLAGSSHCACVGIGSD